jgi:ATP-dependent DNA helicase RecG
LVEESENSETKAATEEHTRLQQEIFPKYKLGLLHGRLKPEEKEQTMANFQAGEYDILVSTSVIEVGVDVPNATVMLIEGANRFGLAQLHQFRGRVGRGSAQSYCLLIPDSTDTLDNERLKILSETNDGFLLAEKDLEQRGPGQFLGTRQSGYTEFQIANLAKIEVIEQAQRVARELIEQDPKLSREENALLAQALHKAWTPQQTDIS